MQLASATADVTRNIDEMKFGAKDEIEQAVALEDHELVEFTASPPGSF